MADGDVLINVTLEAGNAEKSVEDVNKQIKALEKAASKLGYSLEKSLSEGQKAAQEYLKKREVAEKAAAEKAKQRSEAFANNWKKAFKAMSVAAIATVAFLYKLLKTTAEINDQAQKLGMTTKEYQQWGAVMRQNGSNIDSMTSAMSKLSTEAEAGNEAFRTLKVSTVDASGELRKESDIFNDTIKALQGVENSTQRTVLAKKLLGKQALELAPILNMTAEELQNVKDNTDIIDEQNIKNANDLSNAIGDLTKAGMAVIAEVFAPIIPYLTQLVQKMREATGAIRYFFDTFKEGTKANLEKEMTKTGQAFLELDAKIKKGGNFWGKYSEQQIETMKAQRGELKATWDAQMEQHKELIAKAEEEKATAKEIKVANTGILRVKKSQAELNKEKIAQEKEIAKQLKEQEKYATLNKLKALQKDSTALVDTMGLRDNQAAREKLKSEIDRLLKAEEIKLAATEAGGEIGYSTLKGIEDKLKEEKKKKGEIGFAIAELFRVEDDEEGNSQNPLMQLFGEDVITAMKAAEEGIASISKAALDLDTVLAGSDGFKMLAQQAMSAVAEVINAMANETLAAGMKALVEQDYATFALSAVKATAMKALAAVIKNRANSFASGGIVGGSSYSGDKVPIWANSGELILNAAQQRNLASTLSAMQNYIANGNGAGGGQPIINIINNAGAEVSVSGDPTKELNILIDSRVAKGLGGQMGASIMSQRYGIQARGKM